MSECSRPVKIHALTQGADGEYGERIIHANCGSRIADECEHCSKIYRGDSFAILRSGFDDLQPGERAYFVTVTAPGGSEFGQTHGRRRGEPCPCGKTHRRDDEALGTPLDPEAYRYDLAAGFNRASCRMFTLGIQRLRRYAGPSGSVRYVRVAEWQRRGLIHMHAIVIATVEPWLIRRAFLGGVAIPGQFRRHVPVSHQGFEWGTRMDVQEIKGKSGSRSVRAYMAKLVGYVSKSVSGSLHGIHKMHADMLQHAAVGQCRCSQQPGQRGRLSSRCQFGAYRHGPGRRARSGGTERWCRKHIRAYNYAGFTGHVFGRGRSYGDVTRVLLADKRRQHVRDSIAMDIADRLGAEAAERYLDELDCPTVAITAAAIVGFGRTSEPAPLDELWQLTIRLSQDILDAEAAPARLADQFAQWADEHLPPVVPCCIECGQPSEPEVCSMCERDHWEDAHPTLDCRDAERIVWAIAQRRLHLDHAPAPISAAWWAEAELFSAEPLIGSPILF